MSEDNSNSSGYNYALEVRFAIGVQPRDVRILHRSMAFKSHLVSEWALMQEAKDFARRQLEDEGFPASEGRILNVTATLGKKVIGNESR